MKKIALLRLAGVVAVSISFLALNIWVSGHNNEISQESVQLSTSDLPKGDIKEYQLKSGETFFGVMNRVGISSEEAYAIIDSSKEVFDVTKIKAGKLLKLVFVNEAFAAMEYPLNSDEVIHIKKIDTTFQVTKEDIPYITETATAKGIITDSLFVSGEEAGLSDKTILELANIFSSDVDFTTDIQGGDSFSVVYERRFLDGQEAGTGNILSARFINNGKTYEAFLFEGKYYDGEGQALARQFLKSPLNYTRISSGYTKNRTHPITKQVTTHRAIDYAAPKGTPVIATADGKVALAGSKGLLGITVELKHGSYMTQYGHLSGIAKGVKNGTEVAQGDVIGYVGSTGRSTGPHLQYALYENGNPINPLNTNFPRSEPIPGSSKIDFFALKSQLESLLQ